MRRLALLVLGVASVLALQAPAATAPRPGLWGRYLLAYSACVAPAVACQEELVQSQDGIRWAPVAGFSSQASLATDCCKVVRRSTRLYVFDGLAVRRFTVSTRAVRELAPAEVSLDSVSPPLWTDVVTDPAGGLVLLYAVPGDTGGVAVRTATEQPGSDGTIFVTDPGDRLVLGGSAGPISLLRSRSGWVGLLVDGGCLRSVTVGSLRGTYREAACLTTPSPITSPSGYRNARLGELWLYGVTGQGLVRAIARTLTAPLPLSRYRPLSGLSPGRAIGSARFASAQP